MKNYLTFQQTIQASVNISMLNYIHCQDMMCIKSRLPFQWASAAEVILISFCNYLKYISIPIIFNDIHVITVFCGDA